MSWQTLIANRFKMLRLQIAHPSLNGNLKLQPIGCHNKIPGLWRSIVNIYFLFQRVLRHNNHIMIDFKSELVERTIITTLILQDSISLVGLVSLHPDTLFWLVIVSPQFPWTRSGWLQEQKTFAGKQMFDCGKAESWLCRRSSGMAFLLSPLRKCLHYPLHSDLKWNMKRIPFLKCVGLCC